MLFGLKTFKIVYILFPKIPHTHCWGVNNRFCWKFKMLRQICSMMSCEQLPYTTNCSVHINNSSSAAWWNSWYGWVKIITTRCIWYVHRTSSEICSDMTHHAGYIDNDRCLSVSRTVIVGFLVYTAWSIVYFLCWGHLLVVQGVRLC